MRLNQKLNPTISVMSKLFLTSVISRIGLPQSEQMPRFLAEQHKMSRAAGNPAAEEVAADETGAGVPGSRLPELQSRSRAPKLKVATCRRLAKRRVKFLRSPDRRFPNRMPPRLLRQIPELQPSPGVAAAVPANQRSHLEWPNWSPSFVVCSRVLRRRWVRRNRRRQVQGCSCFQTPIR